MLKITINREERMDDMRLSEMAYLNVPNQDRDKSPSPADSMASSATDLSTLPMNLSQRRSQPEVRDMF